MMPLSSRACATKSGATQPGKQERKSKLARWIHLEATKQHGSRLGKEGRRVGEADGRWTAGLG